MDPFSNSTYDAKQLFGFGDDDDDDDDTLPGVHHGYIPMSQTRSTLPQPQRSQRRESIAIPSRGYADPNYGTLGDNGYGTAPQRGVGHVHPGFAPREQQRLYNQPLVNTGFAPVPGHAVGFAHPGAGPRDSELQATFLNLRPTHDFGIGFNYPGTYQQLLLDNPGLKPVVQRDYEHWRNLRGSMQGGPTPQASGMRRTLPAKRELESSSPSESPYSPSPAEQRDTPAKKTKKATPKKATLDVSTIIIAPYTADPELSNPAECREWLAYQDFDGAKKLEDIVDDDWEEVKQLRAQEYIGKIYDALTAAISRDVPKGMTVRDAVKDRYVVQQEASDVKIRKLLATPSLQKAAKARSHLLYEQAVLLHENGCPKEYHEGFYATKSSGRQPERRFRLDATSKCSVRLDKIIEAMQVKVVALDVIEGNNYGKLCRAPTAYMHEKLIYLSSNKTRQDAVDQGKTEVEKKAKKVKEEESASPAPRATKGRKRKSREYAGMDGDTDEEIDYEPEEPEDEDYESPPKRRKR